MDQKNKDNFGDVDDFHLLFEKIKIEKDKFLKRYIPKKKVESDEVGVNEFEALKCETLKKYGLKGNWIWLSECITLDDFQIYHGPDYVLDFNLEKFKYVVYIHESNEILRIAGFNNLEEFENACRFVANYAQ